jgi:hypothetical protein
LRHSAAFFQVHPTIRVQTRVGLAAISTRWVVPWSAGNLTPARLSKGTTTGRYRLRGDVSLYNVLKAIS